VCVVCPPDWPPEQRSNERALKSENAVPVQENVGPRRTLRQVALILTSAMRMEEEEEIY